MIPQRLELTNFLSYRHTAVLDFDGIHLACISGANGAGKSSLLDAITWALFGQSRSRSDDDIVHRIAVGHGEAAEVRFIFELEGILYRVIRSKQVGKSVKLEFQIAAEAGKWKPLSESKVRETQAAIEQLLRMNYDSFTNASFLLQGKADEFTTKTAGRRKEVLADLLGVSQWDRYKERATLRRKEAENERLLLDGRLGDIELELGEENERQAALAAAKADLQTIADQRAAQEKLLEQLRRVATAVKQQQDVIHNLIHSLNRAEQTLASRRQTLSQRQQERAAHQALLDQEATIIAAYAAWQEAAAALQEWQTKADQFNQIEQAKRPHELTLERERSRLRQQLADLHKQSAQVTAMLGKKEAVTHTLSTTQRQLATVNEQLTAVAAQEAALQTVREQLQALESERKLLNQELSQLQNEARRQEQLEQERPAVQTNLAEAQASLQAVEEKLTAVAAQNQRHAVALAELNSLQAEQPRLKAEMNKLKERIDRLKEESGGSCPLCGQPLTAAHRETVVADLQAEGEEKGIRFRENGAAIKELTGEIGELEAALKQTSKLERERQAQQQRQARAEARLAEIEPALAAWDGRDRLQQLQSLLADQAESQRLQSQATELTAAVAARQKLEQEREAAQKSISTAEAQLAEIARIAAEWAASGPAQLTAVQNQLDQDEIAPEAQAELARLTAAAAAVGYDPAVHAAARNARDEQADAPEQWQALQQAAAAVRPLEDALADLREQIAAQEETLAELRLQHDTAVAHLQALTTDDGDLPAVEQEVFRLREAEIAANRRVGAAQQKLAVLDDLRRQRKVLQAERAAVSQRIQRLKLLEKACGRDGVQALLIEQALPEIEEDANELLDRLTGGQMRVTFETQRQLKSQDKLAETLDIRIGDGVGERPYENFSGGEQFRVNFAIRLALSRILARRAGARLQTLVIDEGFGSQDPSGRQRLVEAINSIQDDFARILVITHVDELRDAFPTRIEVSKEAGGSTLAVI
jgi:DNA repair protein SbcC/Rad50